MKPKELFNRWFVSSIEKLKELPHGDGAFAALMVAIPLYERYIIATLKMANINCTDENVRKEIGNDLGLEDRERSIFWEMFRNGFMHQAMPRGGKTKWMVSHKFGAVPQFKEVNGVMCVLLDPWKFADRVLQKYENDSRLITASESFPFASIFRVPTEFEWS